MLVRTFNRFITHAMTESPQDLINRIGETLVTATPHAVIVVDLDQRIRFVNAAAEEIFGYPTERMVDRPLNVLLPAADRARHQQHFRRFANSESTARWMGDRSPIRGRRADGTSFPAEAAVAQLNLDGPEESLFVAILTDRTESVRMEQRLQQFVDVLEQTPDLVGMADPEGRVTYLNAAGRRLLGLDEADRPDRLPDLRVADAHPAWAAQKVMEEGFPAARQNRVWRAQTAVRGAQGEDVPVDQVIIGHADASGEVRSLSTIARDMREQRRLEDELRGLAQALEQSADMVWITDADGLIEYANPAFEAATGYSREEVIGHDPGTILGGGRRASNVRAGMRKRLLRGEVFRGIFSNRTRSGKVIYIDETISPVRDSSGAIRRFIATGRDVTEHHRMERELRRMAHFDPVTGLHNRQYFEKCLAQALAQARESNTGLAVLVIDLDHFKEINDTLGHAAGDTILRYVGRKVAAGVRQHDLVARHGGDELVVMLRDVTDHEEVKPIIERVMLQLREPVRLADNRSMQVAISIGIALYPEAGTSSAALFKAADAAMYRAKENGGNRYAFHSPDLDRSVLERWSLIRALDAARTQEELTLQYQPIVDPCSRQLRGVEALLRWHHPEHGLIGPGSFIPVAEETRQIRELGDWVLREVCRQIAAWQDSGYSVPHVAINVSTAQLDDIDFSASVCTILEETGTAPEQIVLEITEGMLMSSEANVAHNLHALRDAGVAIAIDDFGTGYCSLGYLRRFPVDFIKIDREFIRGVATDQGNRAIVEAVITFGKVFDSWVVAEGIEESAEMRALEEIGIRLVQGFLLAAPLWPDALAASWLQARPGDAGRTCHRHLLPLRPR